MGLFDNLKQNFKHGVDVKLEAPASISSQDPELPVSVAVSASDNQQTIQKIYVEIIAETRDQNFSLNSSSTSSTQEQKVVARAEYTEPFVVPAGETRAVQLSIIMNQGAAIKEQLPEGSGLAQIAGAFEQLQNVTNAVSQKNYTYTLRAVADVEGVAFDPSDQQPLQILKPGDIGGAFNAKL